MCTRSPASSAPIAATCSTAFASCRTASRRWRRSCCAACSPAAASASCRCASRSAASAARSSRSATRWWRTRGCSRSRRRSCSPTARSGCCHAARSCSRRRDDIADGGRHARRNHRARAGWKGAPRRVAGGAAGRGRGGVRSGAGGAPLGAGARDRGLRGSGRDVRAGGARCGEHLQPACLPRPDRARLLPARPRRALREAAGNQRARGAAHGAGGDAARAGAPARDQVPARARPRRGPRPRRRGSHRRTGRLRDRLLEHGRHARPLERQAGARRRRRDHRQRLPRLRHRELPLRHGDARTRDPPQARPGHPGGGLGDDPRRGGPGARRPHRSQLEPADGPGDVRDDLRRARHDRGGLARLAAQGGGRAGARDRPWLRQARGASADDGGVRPCGRGPRATVDQPGRGAAHGGGGRGGVPLAALGKLGAGRHDGTLRRAPAGRTPRPCMTARIHPTAIVEPGVEIGPGTAVWDHVHLRGPSRIGRDCIIGEKTYVAYGVTIGDCVKINAQVYVCTGITIEDRVMIAAGVVFTNDRYPRAFVPGRDGLAPSGVTEDTLEAVVRTGATIGGRAAGYVSAGSRSRTTPGGCAADAADSASPASSNRCDRGRRHGRPARLRHRDGARDRRAPASTGRGGERARACGRARRRWRRGGGSGGPGHGAARASRGAGCHRARDARLGCARLAGRGACDRQALRRARARAAAGDLRDRRRAGRRGARRAARCRGPRAPGDRRERRRSARARRPRRSARRPPRRALSLRFRHAAHAAPAAPRALLPGARGVAAGAAAANLRAPRAAARADGEHVPRRCERLARRGAHRGPRAPRGGWSRAPGAVAGAVHGGGSAHARRRAGAVRLRCGPRDAPRDDCPHRTPGDARPRGRPGGAAARRAAQRGARCARGALSRPRASRRGGLRDARACTCPARADPRPAGARLSQPAARPLGGAACGARRERLRSRLILPGRRPREPRALRRRRAPEYPLPAAGHRRRRRAAEPLPRAAGERSGLHPAALCGRRCDGAAGGSAPEDRVRACHGRPLHGHRARGRVRASRRRAARRAPRVRRRRARPPRPLADHTGGGGRLVDGARAARGARGRRVGGGRQRGRARGRGRAGHRRARRGRHDARRAADRGGRHRADRGRGEGGVSLRVGIVGGGIAGLAAAHFLARAGHLPVIFEASAQLGGLGTHFEHEGVALDRFYHVVLDSDAELCALLADLGCAERLVWRETGMGFLVDGALYGFNTPADLLRFRALGVLDRLRTGLGALYITRGKRRALDLDEVPAADWLARLFGPRVFARLWEPLLRAKFGERRGDVPAYWVWNTLNREKHGGKEVKGYPRGGYRGIAEALRAAIVAGGGEVRLASPVAAIDADGGGVTLAGPRGAERFDAAVSTLPLPLLARAARGPLAAAVPLPDLCYQGVVNVVLLLRRRLSPFYWTAVVDERFPFQGVVETTHVIPTDWTGGRHLVYVMNYCGADTETYRRPDALLERQAVDGLAALYPGFDRGDVEAAYVFRAPHVEPVWTVGYLRRRPAPRVADTRLYLCTTAQAYPRVTAWNTSVALAREAVDALLRDARAAAAPESAVAEERAAHG